MMLPLRYTLLATLLLSAAGEEALPRVFSLPLPKGQKMEFSLIRVCDAPAPQENAFDSFEFNMGNSPVNADTAAQDVDYTQTQAPTSVSGTVYISQHAEGGYWALPMACTELTNAQYASLMTPEKMPTGNAALLPRTGLTRGQVVQFLEALNYWCKTNAEAKAELAKLSQSQKQGTLFCRLPQENEWEFAARGATYVDFATFSKAYPYANAKDFEQHEVLYFNADSIAPRRVKYKNKPNPAGLYDMLGNVREMVEGPFRPEYHFGRVGGMLSRGGCFSDRPEVATCTVRHELPLVDETTGKPTTSKELGLRLVIGSQISRPVASSGSVQALNDQWRAYKTKHITLGPRVAPGETVEDSFRRENAALRANLEKMQQQVARHSGNSADEVKQLSQRMAEMQNQMEDLNKRMSKANDNAARGALCNIIYPCADAVEKESAIIKNEEFILKKRNQLQDQTKLLELLDVDDNLEEQAKVLKIKQSIEAKERENEWIKANFSTYWSQFEQGCVTLVDLPRLCAEDIIRQRDELYLREIAAEKDPARRKALCQQLALFRYSMQRFYYYRSYHKYDVENQQQWVADMYRAVQNADLNPKSLSPSPTNR